MNFATGRSAPLRQPTSTTATGVHHAPALGQRLRLALGSLSAPPQDAPAADRWLAVWRQDGEYQRLPWATPAEANAYLTANDNPGWIELELAP